MQPCEVAHILAVTVAGFTWQEIASIITVTSVVIGAAGWLVSQNILTKSIDKSLRELTESIPARFRSVNKRIKRHSKAIRDTSCLAKETHQEVRTLKQIVLQHIDRNDSSSSVEVQVTSQHECVEIPVKDSALRNAPIQAAPG